MKIINRVIAEMIGARAKQRITDEQIQAWIVLLQSDLRVDVKWEESSPEEE